MSGSKDSMKDKVWIELEPPADCREGDRRAAMLCDLMARLGVGNGSKGDGHPIFFWNDRVNRYCVTVDDAGSFLECEENGHWFYLEPLAGAS